jgi:predicted enzyme related to lactoylglutathione lyase
MSEATDVRAEGAAPAQQNDTVTWWELQVSDLEPARAFYGAVFGWTFQPFGDDFLMASAPDGTPLGGLDGGTGKGESPAGRGVRVYVQVEDLEATLAKVTAAGGAVTTPRTVITEEYGWFATFTDPSGLTLGLVSSNPAR